MSKQFSFKQFSKALVNSCCCFLPIDWTLSDATTPGQSGPGSDGSKEVLRILKSTNITEDSSSDYFVS